MSLFLKYRPQTFDDMIGSDAQIASLKKLLIKKDCPHTYLLVGPPGCGKTTAARIAAKELGAVDLSIREINSANNRGIDTAREIVESARYSPVDGTCTVYIIDEVHQCTKEWQNAMLKILEEPPAHCYFFLCTTDPQKLNAALKTRCTEVKFGAMKPDQALLLLRKVNRAEGLGISKNILEDIADKCEGSARKALVILEKVAGVDPDEQASIVKDGLTEEEGAETIELCRALLSGKTWQPIAKILKEMNTDDVEKIRYAVLGYMNAILLSGKENDRAAIALESFKDPFYNSGKPGLTLACYQTIFTG